MPVTASKDYTSNRIEWIDTAKGICILLVVLHHCSQMMHEPYLFSRDVLTFRMPLYFILSGLFFKNYSPKVFLIKKTNKLLVPYVFFYTVTGVLIPVMVYRVFRYPMALYDYYGLEAVFSMFSERVIVNPSIWFLFCLFEVNVFFYCLFSLSKVFSKSHFALGGLSLAFGILGLYLAYKRIGLPYFLDSSLAMLPFFYFGYFLRNHTAILSSETSSKTVVYIIVYIVVTLSIIHCLNYGWFSVFENTYGGIKGCLQVYPYGMMGTLVVLLLSKLLGRIPVLSYLGRYSIIVLCVHFYVINSMRKCFNETIANGSVRLLLVFLTTILVCLMLIPFFKRYLAVFTAQRDLIKLDNRLSTKE